MTILNHHDRVKLSAEGRELLEDLNYDIVSEVGLVIGSPDRHGATKVVGFCDNEMVHIHINWLEKVGRLVKGTPVTLRTFVTPSGLQGDPKIDKGTKGVIRSVNLYGYTVEFPGRLMKRDECTGEERVAFCFIDERDFIADESTAVRKLVPVMHVSALKVRIGDVLMDSEGEEFVVDHIDATLWGKFGVRISGSAGEVQTAVHVEPGTVEAGRLVPVYYREDHL